MENGIAFLKSESGSRFNQVATDAVSHVLVNYFSLLGNNMVSVL